MTEDEYWRDVTLISREVENGLEILYTYSAFVELVEANQRTSDFVERHWLLWNTIGYSLEMSLFMILGRIFDSGRDAHSINKVVAATIHHPEFFSKESVVTRFPDFGWHPLSAEEQKAELTEPTVEDLKELARPLRQSRMSFQSVYLPVRNKIFGHILLKESKAVSELIGKVEYRDIETILTSLWDFLGKLTNLYHGARVLRSEPAQMNKNSRQSVKDLFSHFSSA